MSFIARLIVRMRELGWRVLAFGRGGRLWSVEEWVVVGLP